MTSAVRTVQVSDLTAGDRMLLKDLRVLEVLRTTPDGSSRTVISYHNLAAQEHDTITVPSGSPCKIIQGGWDRIDQTLADLI